MLHICYYFHFIKTFQKLIWFTVHAKPLLHTLEHVLLTITSRNHRSSAIPIRRWTAPARTAWCHCTITNRPVTWPRPRPKCPEAVAVESAPVPAHGRDADEAATKAWPCWPAGRGHVTRSRVGPPTRPCSPTRTSVRLRSSRRPGDANGGHQTFSSCQVRIRLRVHQASKN